MITALALRLDGLTRSLAYDEIWPWREFSAMTPFDTLVHPRDVRHPLTNMISALLPAAALLATALTRRRPRVDPLLANAARLCLRGFVRCPALLVAAAARAADSNGILFAVVVQPSSTFAEWEAATFDDGGASRWCILNPWLTRTVFVASRDQQGEPGKYINAVFCTSVDSADDGAAARGMLADADPAFYWLQQ